MFVGCLLKVGKTLLGQTIY